MKQQRSLLALLLLFTILLATYKSATPPFEGPDELEHFAYANHLHETGHLPNPDTDQDTPIAQEVAQAPLYYVSASLWASLRYWEPLNLNEVETARNPWALYPAPPTSRDNRNHYLLNPETNLLTPAQKQAVAKLNWMRTVSLVWGLVAVLGVYWGGLALYPKLWALMAALAFAFTPLVLQTFVLFTNDVAITTLGCWVIGSSLHLYDHWREWRYLAGVGILAGLAMLSKTSGLMLVILPMLAIGLAWWKSSQKKWNEVIYALALFLSVALLVGGWWYARGWWLFNDPLGAKPHQNMAWAFAEHQPLWDTLQRIPVIRKTLWVNFGAGEIRPATWGYILPVGAMILSGLGWLRLNKRHEQRYQLHAKALLLGASIVLGVAALVRWMQQFDAVTARLILPFYAALILFIVQGWRAFPQTRYMLAGAFGSLALLMVPLSLHYTLGNPPFLAEPPDGLRENQIVYPSGLKFLGYTVNDTRLAQGIAREFQLCWQTPPSVEPTPFPYAFALHIVDTRDNRIVGGRESYLGLGNLTRLAPDKIFCDEFSLRIDQPLEKGVAYHLILSIFDVSTKQTIAAIEPTLNYADIGLLSAPAPTANPAMLNHAPRFGQTIALLDTDIQHTNDQLTLNLVWGCAGTTPQPLNIFVHVLAPDGTPITQYDGLLGGTRYPNTVWREGDLISQALMLPVPANQSYLLRVGVYDNNFQRLPYSAGGDFIEIPE